MLPYNIKPRFGSCSDDFSKFFAYIIKAVSYEGHLETLFSKASFKASLISSIVSRSGFTTCLS